MKLDLMKLFQRELFPERSRTDPDKTLAAELDAVRSGKKGMSLIPISTSAVSSGSAEYREVLGLAFARDLLVILRNIDPQDTVLYLARPDQLWRIPAYLALWQTAFEGGAWSDAAEAQASMLLGYDAKQRSAWLAEQRHRHAGWGCKTVYTLLSTAQRDAIVALGKRCLGDAIEGMTLFIHSGGHPMKRDAARFAPSGVTVARVGIAHEMSGQLFGPPRRLRQERVLSASIPAKIAPKLNASLRTNVEFLGSRGWS